MSCYTFKRWENASSSKFLALWCKARKKTRRKDKQHFPLPQAPISVLHFSSGLVPEGKFHNDDANQS